MTTFERGQAQAPQDKNSNNIPLTHEGVKSGDKKSPWPKVAIAAVGGIALTVVVPYGVIKAYTTHVNNALEKTGGGDKTNSAEPFPGTGVDNNPGKIEAPESVTLDNATTEEFRSDEYFTDPERVAWAWDKLEQPTSEPGYEGMTRLQAANAKLMKDNPDARKTVEPSLEMSGDEILANSDSISYLAATTTELSDNDRAKVLAASRDNSDPALDAVTANVLERDTTNIRAISVVDISAENNLPVESRIFKHTVLNNGFDPRGVDTKVINAHLYGKPVGSDDGSKQKYYQFIDGKPIQIQQVDSRDKTKRASNPQNIPAN